MISWESGGQLNMKFSKQSRICHHSHSQQGGNFYQCEGLSPSIWYLSVCSKYNCTSSWKWNPLQADKYKNTVSNTSAILDVHIGGSWGNAEGKSVLASISHSFSGVDFLSCWRQNTGLEAPLDISLVWLLPNFLEYNALKLWLQISLWRTGAEEQNPPDLP